MAISHDNDLFLDDLVGFPHVFRQKMPIPFPSWSL